MNYLKIYDDFIKDRRLKENLIDGYFEKHHIVPKVYGGSDDTENIIKLTADDHFFAHLLLAKIHGGKMVFALDAMRNFPAGLDRPDFSDRMKYSWIRKMRARNYSENYSGDNSPVADKNIYIFGNYDKRVVYGTRFQIMQQTGLSNKNVSSLLLGQNQSIYGWCYLMNNPLLDRKQLHRKNNKSVCKKIHHLYHFDGREWSGTKSEFSDLTGGKLHFQSENGHCQGWYKTKKDAQNHFKKLKEKCIQNSKKRGCINGLNNPRADLTKYHFINFKTLEEKFCTRYEMSEFLTIKPARICELLSRKAKTVKGWGLHEVFLVKDKIKIYRKDRHGSDRSRSET